jgi:hypothetical protein
MPRSQSRIVGYMQMLSELQYAVTYSWFAQVIKDNSNLGGSTILEMISPMIEKISPLVFCIGSKAGSMANYNAS